MSGIWHTIYPVLPFPITGYLFISDILHDVVGFVVLWESHVIKWMVYTYYSIYAKWNRGDYTNFVMFI